MDTRPAILSDAEPGDDDGDGGADVDEAEASSASQSAVKDNMLSCSHARIHGSAKIDTPVMITDSTKVHGDEADDALPSSGSPSFDDSPSCSDAHHQHGSANMDKPVMTDSGHGNEADSVLLSSTFRSSPPEHKHLPSCSDAQHHHDSANMDKPAMTDSGHGNEADSALLSSTFRSSQTEHEHLPSCSDAQHHHDACFAIASASDPDPPLQLRRDPDPPLQLRHDPDPPLQLRRDPDPPLQLRRDPDPPLQLRHDPIPGTAGCNAPQSTSSSGKKDLGPFCKRVGLTASQVQDSLGDLPVLEMLTNGLVLELYDFLVIHSNCQIKFLVNVLHRLQGSTQTDDLNAPTYLKRLVDSRKKVRGSKNEGKMTTFLEDQFFLTRKRRTKEPDTPRKKKLRSNLDKATRTLKNVRKDLLTVKLNLAEEEDAKQHFEQKAISLSEEVDHLAKENEELKSELSSLQLQRNAILQEMEDVTRRFEPTRDDLERYKVSFNEAAKKLEKVEKAYGTARERLSKLDTKNVNRKLKRRDLKINQLEEQCHQLREKDKIIEDTIADLDEARLKLSEAEKQQEDLLRKMSENKNAHRKQSQKITYLRKRTSSPKGATSMKSKGNKPPQDRMDVLRQRIEELETLVSLLQDQEIQTFQDGKYTDVVRETIMELLSLNVSMSKVNQVIRLVLKKMSGKSVSRMPALGTISQFAVEARHLADIEVATAMLGGDPQETLGNCIHGDGTTKYHKKYQNYQVTLPDGTQKSFGLMEMAQGNTDAVMQSFQQRIQELANALGAVDKGDPEHLYKELITSITSTMTDQGPTMPQFSERVESLRRTLLPEVVNHWDALPEEVQKSAAEFGTFYCRMHPLINFAEEINRTLKAFEDICTDGKGTQALFSGESGATRLVRTASKAFHHRGSDKCGVEDSFTAYLEHEYDVQNHLVNYVGNRANIIFEGASALYFHLDHIVNFVGLLPDPNLLLKAVKADAEEKVFRAELKALGIFCKLVTDPLWHVIKTADNILDLNDTLHHTQTMLQRFKCDASSMLQGEAVFASVPLKKDILYDRLFDEESDSELDVMCIQALELISCSVLLILERQCKDQLPGGRYWKPSKQTTEKYRNVPTTNMVGERDFAQLDLLVRKMPNARTTTLEALVMWANNGTSQWLDSLPAEEKERYMKSARSHSRDLLQAYKKRSAEIRSEKWALLAEKHQKRKEREEKQAQAVISLTNDVVKLGGVWTTSEMIDQRITDLRQNSSVEVVRRAVYSQLQFLQRVVKCSEPSKEHFQLSSKQKQYSLDEMHRHLVEVVMANKIAQRENPMEPAQDATQIDEPGPSEEEIFVNFTHQKEAMLRRLEEETMKRAAVRSKAFLEQFLRDPKQLIGKRIQHLFVVGSRKQWFAGKVVAIEKSNLAKPLHTVYRVDYDLEEEDEKYALLSDLSKNELVIV